MATKTGLSQLAEMGKTAAPEPWAVADTFDHAGMVTVMTRFPDGRSAGEYTLKSSVLVY